MSWVTLHDAVRYAGPLEINWNDLHDRLERTVLLSETLRKRKIPLFRSANIYDVAVAHDIPLWKVMFDSTESLLNHDLASLLRLGLDQSVEWDGERDTRTIGSLGPFKAEDLNLIDSEKDLVELVRLDILADPDSLNSFCERSQLAFPRLKLSEAFPNCLDSFEGGYTRHTKAMVACLAALNDVWTFDGSGDLTEALRHFSATSGFATTLEGNGDRKSALTFSFRKPDKTCVQVLCEPHMKLEYSGLAGDSAYKYHRLYFSPRAVRHFPQRLLVGHAGKHL